METDLPGREPVLEGLARHTAHRSRPGQYRRGGRSRTAERDPVSTLRSPLSHSQGRR
jgi:hypothetical protein